MERENATSREAIPRTQIERFRDLAQYMGTFTEAYDELELTYRPSPQTFGKFLGLCRYLNDPEMTPLKEMLVRGSFVGETSNNDLFWLCPNSYVPNEFLCLTLNKDCLERLSQPIIACYKIHKSPEENNLAEGIDNILCLPKQDNQYFICSSDLFFDSLTHNRMPQTLATFENTSAISNLEKYFSANQTDRAAIQYEKAL